MTRVLVTGGAGFIGSHVCEACLAAGEEVVVVDNLATGSEENLPPEVRFVRGDLRDPELAGFLMKEFRPDAVYHLAAQSSVVKSTGDPTLDMSVNVTGTLRMLEACRAADPHPVFIYASTGGAIYGDPVMAPVGEDYPVELRSPYGASKHAAEHYVSVYAKLFGFQAVSLRFANIYGPRQRGDLEAGVISIFSRLLVDGRPVTLYGNGKAARDYVYVADAVEAMRLAGRLGAPGGAYNVGTGVATRVEEVLGLVARALGREPVEVRREPLRPGEVFHISLDSARLQAQTGWRPSRTLEAGIAAFAEWFLGAQALAGASATNGQKPAK
ncbi:MAG: SDR family NAD(P)-dependent oxidoreductase [Candidatus Tectomicrobia bacterium]|uniref:SDR family NAD(P)-dependent oxidoreductase n=1 Tax=Tectimicrobiota bacterium TaxID=2528274 RepID=A0A932HY25_UNCTE|nr:SDR family NAD(P)-dependent oxidoreductase [Candidatus Tectomicrobia bacterium]